MKKKPGGEGQDIGGRATTDPPMQLLDLPYDALALIAAKLRVKQQLVLRRACRRTRDLTAGAALAVRLADTLFRRLQSPSSVTRLRDSPVVKVSSVTCTPCGACGVDLHLQKQAGIHYGQPVLFTRARISCRGFEDSAHLAVEMDMVAERFIPSAEALQRAERVWGRDGVKRGDWGAVVDHLSHVTDVGRWEAFDKAGLRFEVSAEGDVAAVSVAFQQGSARKWAGLVGKILGVVLEGVDASKASLLAQCFAKCEDPGKAGMCSQASAKCGEASKGVQSRPSGGAREVAFEESGVRVVTRPRRGHPQDMQVDLTVL